MPTPKRRKISDNELTEERVDDLSRFLFIAQKGCQALEIGLFEFIDQNGFPAFFDLDIAHISGFLPKVRKIPAMGKFGRAGRLR